MPEQIGLTTTGGRESEEIRKRSAGRASIAWATPTSSATPAEEDTMRPLSRTLLATAREQHGLITADDLRREHFVGRARTDALRSGLLVPVHRGVYRIGSNPVTFDQRCAAALLAAPDAALSGATAARWWGLRKVFTEDVHLLARRSIDLRGVHPHRTDLLSRGDVQTRFGLRLLRPGRLLCDLAWHLDNLTLESVFEQMLERRLLDPAGARSAARRFTARGRPGSRRLGEVLESRVEWLRPAESDLELVLWRALDGAGVRLARQVVVTIDTGPPVRLDLADPELRFGIEVDHVTWHGGRLDVEADKRRDRHLLRVGWRVSRVTDEDVTNRLMSTVAELIAIITHLRGERGSP